MSEVANNLLRRIEAIDTTAADNSRRAEAYQRMTEELGDVQGSATSPDGAVTVVSAPDGTVKSVEFSERVRQIAPAELGATVLHTIAMARVTATREQAEVVRRGLGDTELLDQVLDADRRVFGDQRPVDPGPPPQPTRRRQVENDDAVFEDFQVMQQKGRR